jgi:4-alpha-glucanotransferase
MAMDRSSGILLHVSSLPGDYGIGAFGKSAYAFVDFLVKSGQKYWQILPLNPIGTGNSPYSGCSAFAGNPLLIDLDLLEEEGLLSAEDYKELDFGQDPLRVDYEKVRKSKMTALARAYERSRGTKLEGFDQFRTRNSYWLQEYAEFMAFSDYFKRPLQQWDGGVRKRDQDAFEEYSGLVTSDDAGFHIFAQYIFERQWFRLKEYANGKGIRIFGDIPVYVSLDSADVWSHPEVFDVDEDLKAAAVSGCPPDAFAPEGQRWGNPLYRWDHLRETGFDWWVRRIKRNMELYDMLRIDHFRGMESYYSIPCSCSSTAEGEWIKGPGAGLFDAVKRELGNPEIVLEDLGFITDEVVKLREYTGYPGMKVAQFAFSDTMENPALPHNCSENSVIYIGTHDNDTCLGWIRSAGEYVRKFAMWYAGEYDEREFVWKFIDKVMGSACWLSVFQMQDFLVMGSEGRMNVPGVAQGNWEVRFGSGFMDGRLAQRIDGLTKKNGR